MTKLLLRLFVKDAEKTDEPDVRASYGRLAGIAGIVCNVLLFAGKLLAGLLSASVAIMADAVNNLSDAASSLVTLLGFRLAGRPADEEHPYGHARIEYIAGLVVAAMILLIGFELGKSSLEKIISPEAVNFSWLTAGILLASVALKLWLSFFTGSLGKRIGSSTLAATAADSRNDVISTLAVLLGGALGQIFSLPLDGYLGLAVAAFILYSGYGIARDTVSPLLGRSPDEALVSQISALILRDRRVLGMHDLMVHDYGPGQCFASAHAELDAGANVLECHELLDSIEREAVEKLRVHLVLHYDPVVTDDPELNALRKTVRETLAGMDEALTAHDFRMVRGGQSSNLIFDVLVPFAWQGRQAEIRQAVEAKIGARYRAVITFDAPYSHEAHGTKA